MAEVRKKKEQGLRIVSGSASLAPMQTTNFERIRRVLGLSQAAIGAELGMSQGNVYHYEKRGQPVPPDVAERLIEVAGRRGLSLDFNDIYGREPFVPDAKSLKRVKAFRVREFAESQHA